MPLRFRQLDPGRSVLTTDRQNPFSRAAVAGLITVAVAAFGALVLLAAYAPELKGDERGGGSALSRSAIGFAGILQLLRDEGVPVTISRDAGAAARQVGLLVLTPPAARQSTFMRALTYRHGPTLLVLPKWRTEQDKEHPAWVTKAGLIGPMEASNSLADVSASVSRRAGFSRPVLRMAADSPLAGMSFSAGSVDRLQTLNPSVTWKPAVFDEAGRLVLAYLPARRSYGDLYVLADPDLIDTQALKDGAVARSASDLLDALRGGEPITFDVTLDGFGQPRSLLRLLFEPPLLGGTLCAAAAALAVLLMAVRRFGPPAREERALAFGKRALADNAARLVARAGRERAMGISYAQAVRDAVVRSAGGIGRDGAAAGTSEAAFKAILRADGLHDTYPTLAEAAGRASDRAALMRAARDLHTWAEGMSLGRR